MQPLSENIRSRATTLVLPQTEPKRCQSRITLHGSRPTSVSFERSSGLRRSVTLEGRSQLICVSPSRTRESLLSRGRSPSTHSSTSFTMPQHEPRRNNFPNSMSDGALMKRLKVDVVNSPFDLPHLCLNPSPNMANRVSCSDVHHSDFPQAHSLAAHFSKPDHFNATSPYRENHSQGRSVQNGSLPGAPFSQQTPLNSVRAVGKLAYLSGSHQSSTGDLELSRAKITHVHAQDSLTDSPKPNEAEKMYDEQDESRPYQTKSTVKFADKNEDKKFNRVPSFTKHLLLDAGRTQMLKPDGKTFQYPLDTWFATSQPNNNGFLPEGDRETTLESSDVTGRHTQHTRKSSKTRFSKQGLNELAQAIDLLISRQETKNSTKSHNPGREPRTGKRQKRRAPLAKAEEEERMESSQSNTNSTGSKKGTTLLIANRPQPPSKHDKPKIVDLRRTTPRQVKQYKQSSSTGENATPTSGSRSSPSCKSQKLTKTAAAGPIVHSENKTTHGPSLFRTASLHIRSTLSKLKRSDSGHSSKSSPPNSFVLHDRRASDPIYKQELITSKSEEITSNHSNRRMSEKDVIQRNTVEKNSLSKEPSRKSAPPEASPVPPGCSRWSTRLDPPPAVTPNRPIHHTHGPLIFQRTEHTPPRDPLKDTDAPLLHSTPVIPQGSLSNWKSCGMGLAYCSLPLRDVDELNLLNGDCVEVGDLGRINFRTGSFMGRYPQSRGHRCHHPSAQHVHRHWTQNVTPSRFSPSRPLYLSPYQASSSGNTTRSAPSPSLSSMTSASLLVGPDPSISQSKAATHQSPRLVAALRPQAVAHVSSPPIPTGSASFLELDPVLDRLLSDLSSIDVYRSALRPQISVQSAPRHTGQDDPRTGEHTMPEYRQRVVGGDNHPHFRISDPGAIFRLSSTTDNDVPSTREHDLDNVSLGDQIRDLIQLEFSCPKPRSIAKELGPKQEQDLVNQNAVNSRLSEPIENSEYENSADGFGPHARYHPFRWSSGARTSRHKASRTVLDDSTKTKPSIMIYSPETVSPIDQSSGPLTQLIKPSQVSSEPPTSTTDVIPRTRLQLSNGTWNVDPESVDRISIWLLSASQLYLLRKLALVQMTSLAEKHCINRSPFSWRFLKYRAVGNMAESAQLDSLEVGSQSKRPLTVADDILTSCTQNGHSNQPADTNSQKTKQAVIPSTNGFTNSAGSIPDRLAGYSGPVFGQSLESWQRLLGYPVPPAILHMMEHIEHVGVSAHGIFRRPGGKVRTAALREKIQQDIFWNNFDEWQPFDVADLLKQFFRELPECLLTEKLSIVLIEVYNYLPAATQMSLLRWSLLGMPDENRTVLQRLLYLLHSLLRYSDVTQMSASNLAVCFAPSLFRFANSMGGSQGGAGLSPRRIRRTTSGPDPKDLADQRAAQQCLTAMITHAPVIFEISTDLLRRAHLLPSLQEPRDLESIIPGSDWPTWIQTELSRLVRECCAPKAKGWIAVNREAWKTYQAGSASGEPMEGLEIHYRKQTTTNDTKSGPQLRTWRCSLTIADCDAQTVLDRFWAQRSSWDPEVSHAQVIEQISDCVDLCLVTLCTTFPQPRLGFRLLRGRQSMLEHAGCAMLSESVMLSDAETPLNTIQAVGHVLEDHVYIRPLPDHNGCRVFLLSRVDLRGHTPDWYAKHWGHTLVRRLFNLKRSFQSKKSWKTENHPESEELH